jgi:hypothetical protein
MAKEELNQLGLGDNLEYTRGDSNFGEKEKLGFVSGTGVKTKQGWVKGSSSTNK